MPAVHRVRSSAVLRHCPVVLLRQGRYGEHPSLSPLLNTLARNIHTRSGAMCAEPLASTTRGHIQIVESDDDLAMSWNTKIARAPMRFLCSGTKRFVEWLPCLGELIQVGRSLSQRFRA